MQNTGRVNGAAEMNNGDHLQMNAMMEIKGRKIGAIIQYPVREGMMPRFPTTGIYLNTSALV